MSVSVSMPQLGESVTEGTVTRWLKKEGERVEVDEPLLEVSTDKVDTEIPSPASGILRSIAVDEDETVAVGAQPAVIEDSETSDSSPAQASPAAPGDASAPAEAAAAAQDPAESAPAAEPEPASSSSAWSTSSYTPPTPGAAGGRGGPAAGARAPAEPAPAAEPEPASSSSAWSTSSYTPPTPGYAPPPAYGQPPSYSQPAASAQSQPYAAATTQTPAAPPAPAPSQPYAASTTQAPPSTYVPSTSQVPSAPAAAPAPAQGEAAAETPAPAADEEYPPPPPRPGAGEAPYVTPLVRKLAAEHAVNLETVTGTGVGGRIRKQDVIDAARAQRGSQAAQASPAAQAPQDAPAAVVPQQAQRLPDGPTPAGQPADAPAARRPAVVPSSLRGTTQRMSRPRQVIAQRMVESLRTSAQLTTVVEADVTAIARLRARAKADFEAREGVKLTFLPFFALAAVEALKTHPKLNAAIEPDGNEVTYHDAEHLGIAVDTER